MGQLFEKKFVLFDKIILTCQRTKIYSCLSQMHIYNDKFYIRENDSLSAKRRNKYWERGEGQQDNRGILETGQICDCVSKYNLFSEKGVWQLCGY